MSQELGNNASRDRDMNRAGNERGLKKNYEGFEGMNYEQLRQPYNPNYIGRNRSTDERKDSKRPDEG